MAETSTAARVRVSASSLVNADTQIEGHVTFDVGGQTRSENDRFLNNTGTDALARKLSSVPVPVNPIRHRAVSNRLLQLWEGRVLSRGKDEFTAIVQDNTNPSNPEEEVVIALTELGDEDLPLVQPGAVFYWSIRYEQQIGMPRQRVTRIRFRRLPNWTGSEQEQARNYAKRSRAAWRNDP